MACECSAIQTTSHSDNTLKTFPIVIRFKCNAGLQLPSRNLWLVWLVIATNQLFCDILYSMRMFSSSSSGSVSIRIWVNSMITSSPFNSMNSSCWFAKFPVLEFLPDPETWMSSMVPSSTSLGNLCCSISLPWHILFTGDSPTVVSELLLDEILGELAVSMAMMFGRLSVEMGLHAWNSAEWLLQRFELKGGWCPVTTMSRDELCPLCASEYRLLNI